MKRRPKHIVLTSMFFPKLGGAHLWLYELFRRSGIPVQIIARTYMDSDDEKKEQSDFDSSHKTGNLLISRIDFGLQNWGICSLSQVAAYYRMLKSIWTEVEKDRQNIIYCLKAVPEAACLLPLKLVFGKKVKIVCFAHGEEYFVGLSSVELKVLTKIALWVSDVIIANSTSTQKIIGRCFGHSKIEVLTPGIDYQGYCFEQQVIEKKREVWGALNDDIVVFSVARLEKRKNHHTILKVISKLIQNGYPVKYVIGGTGDEEGRLKQMAKNLDLKNYVIFEGVMDDMDKRLAFASCDIHVMASIQVGPMIEGFGIVFLEAAAAGIPSISGNNGGQPEAVIDGETGYVVDGRSIDELYHRLEMLIKNSKKKLEMGKNARMWARKNSWENKIRAFEKIL